MPAFVDIFFGKTPAAATDVQQIIDALSARRNTPLATTVNDPLAYALTLRNNDPAGRGVVIYAPDGATVLFSVDASGARISRSGGPATQPITANDLGSAGAQAAEGNHVHGVNGYTGGVVSPEAIYANSWVTTAVSYAVAAGISWIFCTLGVTVTLPNAAAPTNRPITVVAVAGQTTVNSLGGAVVGGSTNTTTGLVMNGIVSAGDSMTYKSDSTNWRVV